MSDIIQDVVFAWRNALKKPGTTLLIVITLALGIGANTAMFSMAWHVLLAPLPYADQDRLVRLEQNGMNYYPENAPWSDLTLNDFRDQTSSFSHLVEYTQAVGTLVGKGEPFQASIGSTSWNYFEMLGIRTLHGRDFAEADEAEGAEPVMLLSQKTWNSKFNADENAIGTTLEMYNVVYRIIGVLPELPSWPHSNDAWIPAAQDPYRLFSVTDVYTNRESSWILSVYGKLQQGVSVEAAESDVDAVAGRLSTSYPDFYAENYAIDLHLLEEELTAGSRTTFALLMGLAFLVLMIASANVANLNIANTAVRTQELAVREAVGASRWRIRRQLLTESLFLALIGGLLGLVVAYVTLDMLVDFASSYSALASEIRMDGAVLLFAFAIATMAGLVSGSAVSYKENNMNAALKEGGDKVTTSSGGKRKRELLLVVQFALAFVVLTTSSLIILSLYRLDKQDAGYESEQILAVTMLINLDLTESIQVHMQRFWPQLLERTEAIPGVTGVTFLSGAPLLQDVAYLRDAQLEIDDLSDTTPNPIFNTKLQFVSDSYFTVMDIPLLQGRPFETSDPSNGLVIINANLAEKFFPNGDALGKRIAFPGTEFGYSIVGVAGNIRARGLDQEEAEALYIYRQTPSDGLNLYVRSTGNLAELADTIARIVYEIDPRQSIGSAEPLEETRAAWLAPAKLRGTLIFLFGTLALIVTLSGVIGVVSCNIAQRIREIGIHMAIGATPASVMKMFVADGLKVYVGGLLAGLVLMVLTAPLLTPMLFETDAFTPGVYVASTVVLTLAVILALIVPARVASGMSPAEALRCE